MVSFLITARCGPSFTATEILTRPLALLVLIISPLMENKELVNFHVNVWCKETGHVLQYNSFCRICSAIKLYYKSLQSSWL